MPGSQGTIWAEMGLDHSKLDQGLNAAKVNMRSATADMERELQSSERVWANTAESMGRVGMQMSMKVTAPLLAIGTLMSKTTMDFRQNMAIVEAVTGATSDEMALLEEVAREMGATTRYSASQAAQGLEELGRSGFNATQSVEALPAVLSMAAADNMSLARAAQIASAQIMAFGKQAEETAEIADMLAQASRNSQLDIEGIGMAMEYAGPAAAAMGMEFDDAVGIVASLGKVMASASRVGTSFNALISELADSSGTTRRRLEEMNVQVVDAEGAMLPVVDILENMVEQGLDASDAIEIFGQRSGRAAQILLQQGVPALRRTQQLMSDASGTANEMATIMEDNLAGALRELRSATEEASIAWGEQFEPLLELIIRRITELIREFGDLDDTTKRVIISFGIFAAAIGPTTLALSKLLSVALKLKGAMLVMAGPKGWLALLAAGLGTYAINAVLAREETESLEQSIARLEGSQRDIQRLADRYEELAEKAKLSADEQKELLEITQQLAREIPKAITAFDEHTEEFDINLEAVREELEQMGIVWEQLIEQKTIRAGMEASRLHDQYEFLKRVVSGVSEYMDETNKSIITGYELAAILGVEFEQLAEIMGLTTGELMDQEVTLYDIASVFASVRVEAEEAVELYRELDDTLLDISDILGDIDDEKPDPDDVEELERVIRRLQEPLEDTIKTYEDAINIMEFYAATGQKTTAEQIEFMREFADQLTMTEEERMDYERRIYRLRDQLFQDEVDGYLEGLQNRIRANEFYLEGELAILDRLAEGYSHSAEHERIIAELREGVRQDEVRIAEEATEAMLALRERLANETEQITLSGIDRELALLEQRKQRALREVEEEFEGTGYFLEMRNATIERYEKEREQIISGYSQELQDITRDMRNEIELITAEGLERELLQLEQQKQSELDMLKELYDSDKIALEGYREARLAITERYEVEESGIRETYGQQVVDLKRQLDNQISQITKDEYEHRKHLIQQEAEDYQQMFIQMGVSAEEAAKFVSQWTSTMFQDIERQREESIRATEESLKQDIMRMTMDRVDYRKEMLNQEYEDLKDSVEDRALLNQWYYENLRQLNQEARQERERTEERLNDRLNQMRLSSTDYQLLQLEREVEAFRKAEVDKTLIAEYEAQRRKEILESETERAQDFGDTLASTFANAIVQGRKLEDVLSDIGNRFATMILEQAFMQLLSGMGGLPIPTFHSGGQVQVPKLHTGAQVSANEIMAVLRKDERVLTDRQNKELMQKLDDMGNKNVILNINAVDAISFQELIQRNPEAVMQPIIENMAYDGRFRELMGQ